MKLDRLLFSDFARATSFAFSAWSSLNDTVVSFTIGDSKSDIHARQVQRKVFFLDVVVFSNIK